MRTLLCWLVAIARPALASFGDCSCVCCPYTSAADDCVPQLAGVNRLATCNLCSVTFCSSRFPTKCPSSPAGGHTKFMCNGMDDVHMRPHAASLDVGPMLVPLIIGGLGFLCCCGACAWANSRKRRGMASLDADDMPYVSAPHVHAVPMGQPVRTGMPSWAFRDNFTETFVTQPFGHATRWASGTYNSAADWATSFTRPRDVVIIDNHRSHGYHHHHHDGGYGGYGGHGGGSVMQQASHTEGGF